MVEDAILLFEGKLERREGASESDVIVEKVMTIEQARTELTRGLVIRIPYSDDEAMLLKLDGVANVLRRYKGSCPVYLSIRDIAGKAAQFKINSDFWVNASTIHVDELELLLGPGCVLFTGR